MLTKNTLKPILLSSREKGIFLALKFTDKEGIVNS